MAKKMLERVGYYAYFFPTYKQGKKVLWNGMDAQGFKFIDHIPQALRRRTDNTDMLIELKNGSVFQVIGTDNVDSFRGANPVGAVFSEYAWQNPLAWDTIRPILNENGGWAVFNTTPLGKNHAYRLFEAAKQNPKWFAQLLTIENTSRENGQAVITQEDIDEERKMGMEEDMILQEYFCSFDAAIRGSYYAEPMRTAREEQRICKVPYESKLPVFTAWDLGIGDTTPIIFYQLYGKEIRIIDAEEHAGEGLAFYANLLDQKGYKYQLHNWPHDGDVRELGTGKSRLETARQLGINPIHIIPAQNIDDGIQAVRSIFPRLWIDEKLTGFIDAISQYRKEYDEEKKTFKDRPLHDWSSHFADALRYLSQSLPAEIQRQKPKDRSSLIRRSGIRQ